MIVGSSQVVMVVQQLHASRKQSDQAFQVPLLCLHQGLAALEINLGLSAALMSGSASARRSPSTLFSFFKLCR